MALLRRLSCIFLAQLTLLVDLSRCMTIQHRIDTPPKEELIYALLSFGQKNIVSLSDKLPFTIVF